MSLKIVKLAVRLRLAAEQIALKITIQNKSKKPRGQAIAHPIEIIKMLIKLAVMSIKLAKN